ncbi:IclR family transcriptional regulator [Bosea thiooxidans]|nr:IclR family transcriptional regulator [Bosea sp. (in: a-proteobacteria)]
MARDDEPTQKVEAVERALAILESFADGRATLSLGELAESTGLYRSTILRLAASLERFGYLRRGANGRFRLGPSLWRLGTLYQNAFDLSQHVRPVLGELVAETAETAAFYVREGDRRICLYRHQAPRPIRHHVEEGAELSLTLGAGSRVLMAYTDGEGPILERVRQDGYYVSLGERDPESAAIAAPVFAQDRQFVGALAIIGPMNRFQESQLETLIEAVVAKARNLSIALGAPNPTISPYGPR